MVSLGATFAANEETVADVDDEIVIDEDVLSVDESTDALNADEENVIEEADNSDVVSAASTVTNDTFFNYFENDGSLKSNVTADELVFEGEFSDIPNVQAITINKTIKLTGKNAVLNNISLIIKSNNSVIDSFVIKTYNLTKAISIENANNVKILSNNITFNARGDDVSACAIYATAADNLNLQANRVTVIGNKSGNKAVYFIDCMDAVVDGNAFLVNVPSTGYQAGALQFNDGTSNLKFTNNLVNVLGSKQNKTSTCAVAFAGNNVTLEGNDIYAGNDTYVYGIVALGSNSTLFNNSVKADSPNYACGVNLEGSDVTVVDENEIIVRSDAAAYGIYSGMTNGGLVGVYSNNNITATGYFAVGVSLSSYDETVIGNDMAIDGNYTVGVAGGYCNAYGPDWTPIQIPIKSRLVKDNNIVSSGTNVGNASTGDGYFKDLQSVGVWDLAGNMTISNNVINSTNFGIYASAADNLVLKSNRVIINSTKPGSKAVHFIDCMDAVVDDNAFLVNIPSTGYQAGALQFNDGTSNLKFTNNLVNVLGSKQNKTSTCAVAFAGNNVTLEGNDIYAGNDTYVYGIVALGSNSTLFNNSVKADSPNYACGVNLEGSDVTVVDENEIIVRSDAAAYGIYSGMTNGGLVGVYSNNNITATGYFAVGVSLSSYDETVIGNDMAIDGNYTVGVAGGYCNAYGPDWTPIQIPIKSRLVKDNNIVSSGTNVGNASTGDGYFKDLQSVGVWDLAGNMTIDNNNIQTTGDYAINLTDTNSVVKSNYLKSAKGTGVDAIAASGNATIDAKVKTSLNAPGSVSVLLTQIKSGYTIKIVLNDANGKALSQVPITVNGKSFNTDANGVVDYKVTASKVGTQTLTINYVGSSQYVASSATTTVKINKEATKLTAKKKTFKAKVKTKKYTVVLKDSKGKAIKKVKLTLKVKGKTYKATTNAKGKATFKIKNLKKKGKYTAKVKFAGNNLYKASTKKVKITVKK